MFTMQQMRNMFFALQNQSMQNERVTTAERRLDKKDSECILLEQMDRKLEADLNDKHKIVTAGLAK